MKYKIKMITVNGKETTAYFHDRESANQFRLELTLPKNILEDDMGVMFNIDNMIQIEPIEVII